MHNGDFQGLDDIIELEDENYWDDGTMPKKRMRNAGLDDDDDIFEHESENFLDEGTMPKKRMCKISDDAIAHMQTTHNFYGWTKGYSSEDGTSPLVSPVSYFDAGFSVHLLETPWKNFPEELYSLPMPCIRKRYIPCKDFNGVWLKGIVPKTLPPDFQAMPPILDIDNLRLCAYNGNQAGKKNSVRNSFLVFGHLQYRKDDNKIRLTCGGPGTHQNLYRDDLKKMHVEMEYQAGKGLRIFSRGVVGTNSKSDDVFSVNIPSKLIYIIKDKGILEEELNLYREVPEHL